MKDRIPTYKGRVKMIPVAGAENTYDMVRADVPTQEGTPINTATLLADSTAALMELGSEATVNDMLAALARMLLAQAAEVQPIERGGTGAQTVAEAREALGIQDLPTLPISIANGGTGTNTAAQALRNLGITYGTSDLTAGTSDLATGTFYFKYK